MTLEELAIRQQVTEDRSVRNEGRIKQLEEDQRALHELATSIQALATDQANMKEDIGEIKTDVRELNGRAGKHWDGLIDKAVWAGAAGIIAYLAALLQSGV